jgi:hypothetical protein
VDGELPARFALYNNFSIDERIRLWLLSPKGCAGGAQIICDEVRNAALKGLQ